MLSKRVSLFFVILLLFQTIASGVITPSLVNAEGDDQNVFRHVSVKDEAGQDVDKDELEGEVAVDVYIDWSTSGVAVETGHTDSVVLDDALQVSEEQSGTLTVDAEDETIEVGTYDVTTDGTVTAVFNDEIEDNADASGTIAVKASIEGEKEEIASEESNKDESAENEEAVAETETSEKDEMDSDVTENEELDEAGNLEESEEESPVQEDKAEESEDQEEATEENESEDTAVEEEQTKDDETSERKPTAVQAKEEKHGFKLELDEILDLDDEPFDEQHPMDPHKEFKLKLDWELEDGHNYVAGDTETFDLPKGIKVLDEINIELKDDFGQIVANAVITTDKKVELTFTDFVEGHSAVSGWMEIISELDLAEVEEEDGEVIIDPIGEEGELRIPIEELNKDKTIEKQGEPNKGYNADEINWSVTINKNKTSLENARVSDKLPEGTEYKDGSLKVTKLRVGLDGNILGDGEKVEITPEFGDDGELIVPLGDTNDAYRVEYVTEVTDDEKKHFENNATLKDDELDDISAKSTITINRGDALKKSVVNHYDPKTGIIEWQIRFNYNQKDLSDVTLTDAWTPEGMLELVEDSLKFQEVSIDENGDAHHEGDAINLPEGANLEKVDDGFEVTGITTNKAYKVTYQTKVKDRVLDPEDVKNVAGFGSESDGSGTHVGQFYGSKSAGTIDYAEKTIEWTIRVNQDEYPMEKISIEDTLGEGLALLEDTIEITVDGEEYNKEEHGDYTISGDNPFTIDFPDTIQPIKKSLLRIKQSLTPIMYRIISQRTRQLLLGHLKAKMILLQKR